MLFTRRQFGQAAIAAIPMARGVAAVEGWAVQGKPNSKWAGVQVGMNVPYNFGRSNGMPAAEILSRCVQLGCSAVELRGQPIENFLGAPATAGRGGGRAQAPGAAPAAPGAPAAGRGQAGGEAPARGAGGGRAPLSPEQQASQRAAAEELRKWRTSVSLDKLKDLRRQYDDAGVLIEIVKWDGLYTMSDDEVDYCFEVAKALGARALSSEISVPETKRIGQFADKHKIWVGYHGHAATGTQDWETAFSYAKYNGANVDLGHFIAGQNTSPLPFIKAHPDRITHVHIKDRKLHDGDNVPLGEGDTPIKEALQLIRDNKWPIQATLEFEYPVPQGSDYMAELAKSLAYCRSCLV